MDIYENTIAENSVVNLYSTLDNYWTTKKFCDITLRVEGTDFRAHRNILSCACDYFRCLVEHDTANVDPDQVVHLGVLTKEGVSDALHFIYTGRLSITMGILERTICTADFLQFTRLTELCMRFINREIRMTTILTFYRLSRKYHLPELHERCLRYVARRMRLLSTLHSFFEKLEVEEMLEIMGDPRLVIRGDKSLYATGLDFSQGLEMTARNWQEAKKASDEDVTRLMDVVTRSLPTPGNVGTEDLKLKYFAAPVPKLYMSTLLRNMGRHPIRGYGYRRLAEEHVTTFQDCPPDQWVPTRFHFYVFKNWNSSKPIGGIDVMYESLWDRKKTHMFSCGLSQDDPAYDNFDFFLASNERIVSVAIQAHWMINSIAFETSAGRKLGPFGSGNSGGTELYPDEEKLYLEKRKFCLYFHGFSFVPIETRNARAINEICVHYTMGDTKKFYDTFGDNQKDNIPFYPESEYE